MAFGGRNRFHLIRPLLPTITGPLFLAAFSEEKQCGDESSDSCEQQSEQEVRSVRRWRGCCLISVRCRSRIGTWREWNLRPFGRIDRSLRLEEFVPRLHRLVVFAFEEVLVFLPPFAQRRPAFRHAHEVESGIVFKVARGPLVHFLGKTG